MAYETHLLALFDESGKITTCGKISLEEMGGGHGYLSAEGRHFVQLELSDDLRNASSDEIQEQYVMTHREGRDARISRREES